MTDVDYHSLSRILTLRYDPKKKPVRKPLSAEDFTPKSVPNLELEVIKIVNAELQNKQHELKINKISMSLSSGVDSGFTLAMIRKYLPDVKVTCISVGFGAHDDEVPRAKELSRIYDADFHAIVKEDILSELPKLINIVKEPRWNIYQYYTLEYGKTISNVFYSGDGGDELFGGYTFRYHKFLDNLPNNATWKDKAKLYLSCHERDWIPEQEEIFGNKIKFSWEDIYSIFKPYFENSLHPVDQIFLSDFNGKLLFDWLPTNLTFSKFFDLDIESLFLNEQMIRFATHIPWTMKFDGSSGHGKIPLRSILLKQKGFEKYREVKKGFAADLSLLWKRSGHEIVNKYLNADSEIVKNEIISLKWLQNIKRKLEDNNLLDPRYVNKMISILALEIWYRLLITKTISATEKL
ncbi:MAG: asparagine synthase [Thaumarchaeota archaeon]|nr:asparagine synthase [Nitrososphaerota archaeon]